MISVVLCRIRYIISRYLDRLGRTCGYNASWRVVMYMHLNVELFLVLVSDATQNCRSHCIRISHRDEGIARWFMRRCFNS
jgi:hypothetical protein